MEDNLFEVESAIKYDDLVKAKECVDKGEPFPEFGPPIEEREEIIDTSSMRSRKIKSEMDALQQDIDALKASGNTAEAERMKDVYSQLEQDYNAKKKQEKANLKRKFKIAAFITAGALGLGVVAYLTGGLMAILSAVGTTMGTTFLGEGLKSGMGLDAKSLSDAGGRVINRSRLLQRTNV